MKQDCHVCGKKDTEHQKAVYQGRPYLRCENCRVDQIKQWGAYVPPFIERAGRKL